MAEITGTINGGTPPYSIVIRKVGETTGNRCTSGCNGFPTTFTEDSGDNSYYFTVTDSSPTPCLIDSRVIEGGTSNVNCDVVQPSFNAQLIQPICINGVKSDAVLKLTNMVGGYRYKICYNTVSMNCAACTDSDGFITGSTLDIILNNPQETTGNRGVLLRVYADSSCVNYKEFFTTIVNPTCEGGEIPDFSVEKIQPTCSSLNGNVVDGVLKLSNITNATRYKICYNSSTFSTTCNSNCGNSDEVINTSSTDIVISSPTEGNSQTNTIRFYNGSGCSLYKDYTFEVYSPICSQNQITYLNLDYSFIKNTSQSNTCPNPTTNDFDIYVTLNTNGVAENGQKALNKSNFERNVPNGNDVPNVLITSSFDINHGPGAFYRWGFNISALLAKYPSIKVYIFDVYAKKRIGTTNNILTAQTNVFAGVVLTKVAPQTVCVPSNLSQPCSTENPCIYRNATDHGRTPNDPQIGGITPRGSHNLNTSNPDYRRIATFTIDTMTIDTASGALGNITWTNIT